MTERTIYVTSSDFERLRFISGMTEAKDRGDLIDLVDELNRALVVPPAEVPADVVTMNSRVRLTDLDSGKTHEYTLVYPQDANYAEGKISIIAPVGAAMIGYREGDEFEWQMPSGRRRFRVDAVLYQPEAAGDTDL